MRKTAIVTILASALFAPSMSSATPVTIVNGGFENSLVGWSAGGYVAGILTPTAAQYDLAGLSGQDTGFAMWESSLSQTLAYEIKPDAMLTLNVDVGWRTDNLTYGDYSIELWAVNTMIASTSSQLTQGQFTSVSLTYNTQLPEAAEYIGNLLTIKLVHTGDWQVNFDNVSMSNDHIGAAVPEPGTLLLLGSGLLGLGLMRKRKKIA